MCVLSRRPTEVPASQNMEMEMEDGLPGISSCVGDDTVTRLA